MTERDRHRRLCNLVAIMQLQEQRLVPREIPSAFTLLKAEYGLVGTRIHVYNQALEMAQMGVFGEYMGN